MYKPAIFSKAFLRTGSVATLLQNLVAFILCAYLAFARNINHLFYHFDGSYMLIDVRNQFASAHPLLSFSNNFLQSIGNLEFPQNARLLLFFWPIGWIANQGTAKITSYAVIGVIVFLSAYALARSLSQSRFIANLAGWILSFLAMPFVPRLFFYEILNVAPAFVVLVVAPVVTFCAFKIVGRRGLLTDVAMLLGLVALAIYVLGADPILAPLLAPAVVTFATLPLLVADSRAELYRKIIVLTSALVVMLLLRLPWYLFGLFAYTAPHLSPNDFTEVYSSANYASILFQGRQFGWSGPLLVALSTGGALVSWQSSARQTRVAARLLLAWITFLVCSGAVLSLSTHWIFPPPVYFELSIWPLYALFSAIALYQLAGALKKRLQPWVKRLPQSSCLLPFILGVFAFVLVVSRDRTPSGYPYPPRTTRVVDILRESIALQSSSSFNGRVATIIPVDQNSNDAWLQQLSQATAWAQFSGNDEMSLGLWYYRVPTLFEYNQFQSPVFHALIRRALQRPPVSHQRNITVITYPNARVLKLLGVRYVLTPEPAISIGEVRATEDRAGRRWDLIELSEPNLATYSPTEIQTQSDLASMLDFVTDDKVDLTKRAVATQPVDGALVPLRSSSLSTANQDLHISAESNGRSLVVVPVEYSHCLELRGTGQGASGGASLLRIDGLLTGLVFDRHVDVVLSFRIGPLHNPLCRWQDYRDIRAMLH